MFGADYATYAPYVNGMENESPGYDNSFIPEYLLPLFHPPHPWQTSSEQGLDEDFVMVAEFSEIEGPKPMMCIPKDGGLFFNQNDFAVKIMAVDHQTSTSGFSISEDVQVVISDTDDGVNSFVHHFVLFDIEARGFVRPFCMAYITSDKRKIMTFYDQMSAQFKKVARFLKYGNRLVFIRDLERREMDLQYSLGQLRVEPNSSESSNPVDTSEVMSAEELVYRDLQKIRQSMDEIQYILTMLKPLMNDTRMESYLQTLEEKVSHENLQHSTTCPESISLSEQDTDNLNRKPVRCCSWNESTQSCFSMFQQTKPYTPKLVQATRNKKFDCALRSIHELCCWGAKEGIKKLRQIQEYYNRETLILEIEQDEMMLLEPPGSLVTCGQCITSNFLSGVTLYNQELSSLSSGPIGALNFSRLSMSDRMSMDSFKSLSSFESFEDDGEVCSIEQMSSSFNLSDSCLSKVAATYESTMMTQKPVLTKLTSEISCESDSTSSVYQTDEAPSLSEPVRMNTVKQGHVETPVISSNTSEISGLGNQNTESNNQIPPNEEHSKNHSTFSSLLSSSLQAAEFPSQVGELTNQITATDVHESTIPNRNVSKDLSNIYSDGGVAICEHKNNLNSANLSPCSWCSVSPPCSSGSLFYEEMKRVTNFPSNGYQASQESVLELGEKINENQDNIPNSSEEETAYTSSTSSSFPTSRKTKNGLFSLGDIVNKLEPGMPGYGILSVLSTYNHLPHILFSLLTGRTVLVVGSLNMENEVIAVVKALSIFLPDHRRKHSSLVEWLSKPLRITDLGRIKLAGVCRPDKKCLKTVIPSVIKKYVSVFDMERKTVTAPTYQGSLLNVIFSKRKVFSTDAEFAAFIHCWFMEISSKAFIFYHTFCLGTAGSIINDYRLHNQGEHYRNTVKSFMVKLSILDSDVHIIEYLCEIVKMSELEPGMKLINTETGVAVRPISLSHETCQLFRS